MWRRVFHRAVAMVLRWRVRRAKRLSVRCMMRGDRKGAQAAMDRASVLWARAVGRDRRARGGLS